jgi:hypothetical protein
VAGAIVQTKGHIFVMLAIAFSLLALFWRSDLRQPRVDNV